jgi:hypothetical protein
MRTPALLAVAGHSRWMVSSGDPNERRSKRGAIGTGRHTYQCRFRSIELPVTASSHTICEDVWLQAIAKLS